MRQNWGYYTRLTGEGNGTPPQYSCLENPMNGGAWKAAVHGVTEGRTRLSNFTFTFHFHALEKEMATHSSVFAWRIPGIGKPSGLPSIGSHRVRHDWSDLAAAATDGIIVPVLQDPTTIELDWDQKEGFCFCFFSLLYKLSYGLSIKTSNKIFCQISKGLVWIEFANVLFPINVFSLLFCSKTTFE